MIKDSLRKQEEQRKTNNSVENRSRDAAIAKKKDKAMEKILKQANDETKQKKALELMLLIRRCKGLTKVLEAKKNGDMKATPYWPSVLTYVLPFTISGHPIVTMPIGKIGDLPLGVQVIGKRDGDDELLNVCRVLEDLC